MYRPDRPLVVKCSFDGSNKRITFTSAQNCGYDLLRHKVEHAFSLYATSYAISYKDDDGEVTDITTDADLTEAIAYFQAGSDDPPVSSGASILSVGSLLSRKITLRVQISVDYDGPSLSDTSSLVSLDEYKNRNGSEASFSFGAPSIVEPDDDSVTVSSKDAISHAARPRRDQKSEASWDLLSEPVQAGPNTTLRFNSDSSDPFADRRDPPTDPAAVFERLKLDESERDDASSIQQEPRNLYDSDRGAAWLRDQNARTIQNILGALPEPSISSGVSSFLEPEDDMGGALALEQDTRGKYYYSYTSSSASHSRESGYYDEPPAEVHQAKPRPSSRNLHWLAAQQQAASSQQTASSQSTPRPPLPLPPQPPPEPAPSSYSPDQSMNEIPRELLQFLPVSPPSADTLTDCSECGVLLDSIRYVCAICGPKRPVSQSTKGKGRSNGHDPFLTPYEPHEYSYPPRPTNGHTHYHHPHQSQGAGSSSSRSSSGSSDSFGSTRHIKPLPRIPGHSLPTGSAFSSQATLIPPSRHERDDPGYELCSGCIEHAGVDHAVNPQLRCGPSSPSMTSPSSPEEAQRALQWRRSAPKKGTIRHAYREKVWGHFGWEDVEQDDSQVNECSTCAAVTSHQRYKCASCVKFNLCRGCYSQVHDLHPSHAFLAVPDQAFLPEPSEPDLFDVIPPDIGSEGEKSMVHPGVVCGYCKQDIVGARFHCVVCDNVDICANCESAGLPGNLESSEGGHTSSHISIKIPYPLETDEVEMASRRANNLWKGRDAASVGLLPPVVPKANSVISGYARTVISTGTRPPPDMDHHTYCTGCGQNIVGVRYQCANCPSPQGTSVSLCANCEARSYTMHDPSHVFFKLPRPVQEKISSFHPYLPKLYKAGAGPSPGMDPQAYLANLKHPVAVCDRCMSGIQGVWFRCAYCAADYCDACEAVDTHNDAHCFMMFKSPVDMTALKTFAPIENPPPVIPYAIYR
ncbi:hypothetical protein MKEN_01101200 [Mycena kentingensis (nom. inval.)]|nr:hypothetical protein MKEN_01101200 [Mycena kentingensis (nom. inval.)]